MSFSGKWFKVLALECAFIGASLIASASFAAESRVVRLGMAGTSSDVIFALAEARGYFRAEDLDVKIETFKSAAQMIPALGTSQLDVIGAQVGPALYNAATRGVRLRIVASKGTQKQGFGSTALLVRRDLVERGEYKNFSDLKSRKVAILSVSPALNAALAAGKLSYQSVQKVELAYPQHLPAFVNAAIDASISAEPYVSQIVSAGAAVRVAGSDEFYPNQQTSVLVYSETFAEKRRDLASAFMRAYLKAVRVYAASLVDGHIRGPDASEIINLISELTGEPDTAKLAALTPAGIEEKPVLNDHSLLQDLKFFQSEGLIAAGASLDAVRDSSFLDEADATR